MKIRSVGVHPVRLSLTHLYRDRGHTESFAEDVFVKVETDEGIVGWGATAPRTYPTGETLRATVSILTDYLIPALIGEDPFQMEAISAKMDQVVQYNYAAKTAIDVALYDLMGKALGVPVYQLLGGCYRTEMPAFELIPLVPPEEAAGLAAKAWDEGVRSFKVKMSVQPRLDLARVEAVRRVVGEEGEVAVDANMSWTPKVAIDTVRALQDYRLYLVEQPVYYTDLDGMALVTQMTETQIGADESCTPGLVSELARRRGADVFNVKLTKFGGLWRAKKVTALAEAMGIPCIAGAVIQGSLLDAASAHFFASTKAVVYNEAGKAPAWIREDPTSGLRVEKGMVQVPQGPGLGVKVDEGLLKKHRVE
ncbi:MAG: mandelate racemase/muconate lactonizing enzyme family protein [Dehalococcoidia bacterium]